MPDSIRMVSERKTKGRRAAVAKARSVTVKFAPDQHDTISQRANDCGMPLAVWMRAVLLQAALRPANNGYLRIREPDGTMI